MTTSTVLRTLPAGLLLAAGAVLALPGTAHACSCVSDAPRGFVERADAVVWAEVRDARVPTTGMGRAEYLLEVREVYKGEVTERVVVESEASGAACGLEGIVADRGYAFFLQGSGEEWTADLCGGTGTPRSTVERVVAVGAGAAAAGAAGEAPSPGGPDRLPVSAWSYAGMGLGGAGVLVAAGVAWWRRRPAGDPGSGARAT